MQNLAGGDGWGGGGVENMQNVARGGGGGSKI